MGGLTPAAAGRESRDEDERTVGRVVHRGSILGRYYLEKWYDTEAGRLVPSCTVKMLQPEAATFLGSIPAELNDRSFIHLPNGIGLLRGRISRVIGSTMTMSVEHRSEGQRNRLASHILWFDQMSHVRSTDRRIFPRFPPVRPDTVIALPGGRVEPCQLVDISPTGAAVRAHFRPDLESKVILGQIAGMIARHMDLGFAVRFNQLQNPAMLDDLLAPPAQADGSTSMVPAPAPAGVVAEPADRRPS